MSPPSGDYRRRSSVQKSLEVSRRGCSADEARDRRRASECDTIRREPSMSPSRCDDRSSALRSACCARESSRTSYLSPALSEAPPRRTQNDQEDPQHSRSSCRPRLSSRYGRGDDESPRPFRDSVPSRGSVHQPQMDQDQRRSTQINNEHDELCDVLRSALRYQSPDEVAAVIKSSFPTERPSNMGSSAYDPDPEYFCDDTPPRQAMRSSQYECPRQVSYADESFRGSQMGGRTSPPRGSDNLDRGTLANRPRSRNSHRQQRSRSQSELRYASDVDDVRYSEHDPRESLPSGSRRDDGVQDLDIEVGRSKEPSVGQCAGSARIPSDFAHDEEVFYDTPVQVFHDPRHRSPDDRQCLHASLRERPQRTSSRESCSASRRPDPPRPSSQVGVRRSEPEPRSSSRGSHVRRPSAQDYPRHSDFRDARVSQSGGRSPQASCRGARVSARTSAVDCQNNGRAASRSLDRHQGYLDNRLSACEEPRRRPSHSPHRGGRSHREISSRRDVSGRALPSVPPEMVTSAQVGSGPLRGVFRGTWLSDTSSDVTRNSDQESIRQGTTHMRDKCTTSFNTVPEVEMTDEMERGLSPSRSCSGARPSACDPHFARRRPHKDPRFPFGSLSWDVHAQLRAGSHTCTRERERDKETER